MCLGVYGKVVSVSDDVARVDFGGSLVRDALIGVEGVHVGDFVVVHAGVIVSKLSREDLLETFRYVREMADILVKSGGMKREDVEQLDIQMMRWLRPEKEYRLSSAD